MKLKGTVWVLGASSGLGLATANAFAKDGWLVVAGARSFEGEQKETDSSAGEKENQKGIGDHPPNVNRLSLDVTDEKSASLFVERALAISGQVDVLCYAAGLLVLGSCEETGAAAYERVMQTNFIGMTRMVEKVLPIMRKQGSGNLVLFSSINGLVATPFQSAYTASKHAIEGYAQCLSMETRPFGIRVCVVEPGDHQGGSQRYRLYANEAGEDSVYKREYKSACRTIHRDEASGLSPAQLGRKVVRNANRKRMKYRLRVAKLDQRAAVWMKTLLRPDFAMWALRKYYVKKG